MLDTLQKMSGTTHKSFADSKTITIDSEAIWMQKKGEHSVTITTKEVPVISYNDMAFISERNSIIFRAGDSPIWNRNETILPMSWRLFQNTIQHAGHNYTLQTIPTLSSALDFDVRKNQPDFNQMLSKRMEQAVVADAAKAKYQEAYGYSDYELSQLDIDVYSDEIMEIINNYLRHKKAIDNMTTEEEMDKAETTEYNGYNPKDVEENTEQLEATRKAEQELAEYSRKIYAEGKLSKEDLVSKANGGVNHSLDKDICEVYKELKGDLWQNHEYFCTKNGGLYSVNGSTPYIIASDSSDALKYIQQAAKDPNARVFSEDDGVFKLDKKANEFSQELIITDDFYHFLIGLPSWKSIAHGRFDQYIARRLDDN